MQCSLWHNYQSTYGFLSLAYDLNKSQFKKVILITSLENNSDCYVSPSTTEPELQTSEQESQRAELLPEQGQHAVKFAYDCKTTYIMLGVGSEPCASESLPCNDPAMYDYKPIDDNEKLRFFNDSWMKIQPTVGE